MKYYIFSLGIFFGLFTTFQYTYATFQPFGTACTDSNSTLLSALGQSVPFPKIEGKYTLCAKELITTNYFAGKTITANTVVTNTCSRGVCVTNTYINYTVNGAAAWIYYPANKAITIQDAQYATHVNADGTPNQSKVTIKLSSKTYYYDITPPTCGAIELKKEDGTPYYGGWNNQDILRNIKCVDALSGCKTPDSGWGPAATGQSDIKITFTDKSGDIEKVSGNSRLLTCPLAKYLSNIPAVPQCSSPVGDSCTALTFLPGSTNSPVYILSDTLPPTLGIKDEIGNIFSKDVSSEESFFATGKTFTLQVTDPVDKNNTKPSSIRSVTGVIIMMEDALGNRMTPTSPICSIDKYYMPKNANGRIDEPLGVTDVLFPCMPMKRAGKYEMSITIMDWAGNVEYFVKQIRIVPNLNILSKLMIIPSSPDGVYADNRENYTYIIQLADSYDNPLYGKSIRNMRFPNPIYLNEVNKTGDIALTIDGGNMSGNPIITNTCELYEYTQYETTLCPELSTITQNINTCTQNGFPAPNYTKNVATTTSTTCPQLSTITQKINTCTQNGFPAPSYTKNVTSTKSSMCSWWQKIISTCSSNITTTTVTCPQLSTITQKINTCTQNGFPAPSYTKNNTTTTTASCPELPNITQKINTCTQNGFPAPNYTKNNTPQTRTTIDINVYNAGGTPKSCKTMKMVYTPSFQPINYPIPIYKGSSIQSSSILPPSWTSSPSISIGGHIGPAMVGSIAFKVRSYTPGQIQNLIELEMYSWNKNYEDIPQVLRVSLGDRTSITPFYKLFAATMQLTNGENKLIFGQIQNLIFERRTYPFINNLPLNALQDMATNYKDYFIPSGGGYIFSNKAFSGSPESIRFIPEQTSKTIGDAGIKASPNMTYNLDGKRVEYPLSSDFKNYDPITLTGGAVNRIYIFGNLSSKGKETYVNDVSSITKMNFATLSNIVRKQSALLTRARNPDGSIINDVKYVKGDISLSGDDYQWKTLIVLDGNISFIGNFNSQKKNIGIISIRSIPSDLSKGNIYIKPNVVYIFGTIFAEGSVESVNGDGTVFPLSDINRTKNLQNQIILGGGLYTRNTIGGAILGASTAANYMLPGNRSTTNISEAVKFDLSFLRMNNVGYDMPLNKNYNQGRVESVVIIPSSESLMNPPPGFAISKQ